MLMGQKKYLSPEARLVQNIALSRVSIGNIAQNMLKYMLKLIDYS